MSRVKRGVTAHAKHKKVYKAAKGFYGRRKNTIRAAKAAVDKAGQYAFRDRKRKKRTFRALWIQRINAAVRPFGMTYSVLSTASPSPASRSIVRCCLISPSPNRRRSRRSPRRPRPRWRPEPPATCGSGAIFASCAHSAGRFVPGRRPWPRDTWCRTCSGTCGRRHPCRADRCAVS